MLRFESAWWYQILDLLCATAEDGRLNMDQPSCYVRSPQGRCVDLVQSFVSVSAWSTLVISNPPNLSSH